MRTLLLMRGAPGAGKSTWIKEHNLTDYTICPDEIRKLCASRDLQPDGTFKIAREQLCEQTTWKIVFDLLDFRMSRGEFTVVDGTCSKTKDMQKYRELAEKYRYRTFVVDFTDVPLEVCLKQNKMRDELKQVPETAIRNIYARFATQTVPGRIKVIKPEEFDTLLERPVDVSDYRKLVFVGDIHGCYDTLMQYPDFREGLKDDTEYIFLGDFIDRGNQNAEVMHFVQSIMDKPNVCILEGNHERYLRLYGVGEDTKKEEFENKTKPQLQVGGYTEKMARMFYQKVRQFSHITYNGLEILACHAGIPNLKTNLLYIPTYKFIMGAGRHSEYVENAESWMAQTASNCYLIHGHRNTEGSDLHMADRVFNLEGRVEFGGSLRIIECEMHYGRPRWNEIELPDCQPVTKDLNTEERPVEGISDAVLYLRNNRFIQEKELGDGISSFNFTREAFENRNWTHQTILARGLFIDTNANKIMARSYEKFFKIDETASTELAALKTTLKFPVKAYLKENGFLVLVAYDYNHDDLFIATKSTIKGDFADWARELLKPYYNKLLQYLKLQYEKEAAVTLVFEGEDIENDPHIIKYEKNNIILLDAIENTLKYNTLPYEQLTEIAEKVGCPVKKLVYTINIWEEFRQLYADVQDEEYKYEGNYIEGFVFIDENGFMTKCKTAYYNKWKKLRGLARQTLKCGYTLKTGNLQTEFENLFYGFCQQIYSKYYDPETKTYPIKVDIITLRDRFLKEEN